MIPSSEPSRISASDSCFLKRLAPSVVYCVYKPVKSTHYQQYMRFSFKLFLIVNVDKITLQMTVNLEPWSAKLKKKDMLSICGFCFLAEPLNYWACADFDFQTKHDKKKLKAIYS